MLTAEADIEDGRPDRITVVTDYRCNEHVKAIPGAKWAEFGERVWTLPRSWPTCLALRNEFGPGLTIGDNLRKWAVDEAAVRSEVTSLRERLSLPEEMELPDLPGFDALYPFQQVDARMIATAKRMLILNQTGTGKTRSALAGMALAEHEGGTIFPMLVVAPKSMLVTWARDEIKNFFPEADVSLCAGTPAKVRKALEPGHDVYVIGWSSLRTYSRHAGFGSLSLDPKHKVDKELNQIDFKSAIVDEIHRGKAPTSQQTRALWKVIEGLEYRVGLTGTPIQDTPDELWSILRALRDDEYKLKSKWIERFVQTDMSGWGHREIIGLDPIHGPEFLKAFDSMSRRVTKKDALPFLPEKVHERRWVELPPKLRKAYNEMRDNLLAELEEGKAITAGNPLEAAGRLVQMANSAMDVSEPDEEGNVTYRMTMPSPKIEAFMSDLGDGDYDGQQLVIFSDSRQLADLLVEEMRRKKLDVVEINGSVTGDDRQAAIDKFQSGEVPFVVCTRAGSEGVTLTAASTMVRLVRSWSSTVHTQSEDRIHRIGSERHSAITYVDYIVEETVEEKQIMRLTDKERRAQEILRDELAEMIR